MAEPGAKITSSNGDSIMVSYNLNKENDEAKLNSNGADPITNIEEPSNTVNVLDRESAVSQNPEKSMPALLRTTESKTGLPRLPAALKKNKTVPQQPKDNDITMGNADDLATLFGDLSMLETKKSRTKLQPNVLIALPPETQASSTPPISDPGQKFQPGFAISGPTDPETEPSAQVRPGSSRTRNAQSPSLAPKAHTDLDNPFPLPTLSQDQLDELQLEPDLEWEFVDDGFPQWKKDDLLRVEKLRRERQLQQTGKVYIRKRAWIAEKIEELEWFSLALMDSLQEKRTDYDSILGVDLLNTNNVFDAAHNRTSETGKSRTRSAMSKHKD